jgi:hypothetical protein
MKIYKDIYIDIYIYLSIYKMYIYLKHYKRETNLNPQIDCLGKSDKEYYILDVP